MIIGNKEFENIIFTNEEGEVLAVVMEEEIIELEGLVQVQTKKFVPRSSKGVCINTKPCRRPD